MSNAGDGPLLGRVVVATKEGRDRSNSFCLVVAEEGASVTMIPLPTTLTWDPALPPWGTEVPNIPPDPTAAVAACPIPMVAEKRTGSGATVCFLGDWEYELWDGQPRAFRYL
jgi:hypothetical protein